MSLAARTSLAGHPHTRARGPNPAILRSGMVPVVAAADGADGTRPTPPGRMRFSAYATSDQTVAQVEPTPQATRVGLHQAVGHVRQVELSQDRVSARRRLLTRAAKQPRHHVQVLASGHGRFDGGILPS